jgi:PEP-CTERM motif
MQKHCLMKITKSIVAALYSRSFGVAVAASLLTVVTPITANAQFFVETGWDLLHTVPQTQFLGVAMEGVSIGNFNFSMGSGDFGRGIGVQNVGDADTIIKRVNGIGPSAGNTTGAVNLEVVALQLKTTTPTTFGMPLPLDFYYLTLQSARVGGGAASLGSMNITFDANPNDALGGTFTSSLLINFDLRQGGLNGTIVFSSSLLLGDPTINTAWSRFADPAALLITGVNNLLPDISNSINGDFHVFFIHEPHPQGVGVHDVVFARPVPEPSTYGIIGGVMLVVAGLARARRRHIQTS